MQAVQGSWLTIGALGGEWVQGAQKIEDPQSLKALGALLKYGVGEVLAKKTKHIPVIGFLWNQVVADALEEGIGWAVQWANVDENAAADPLVTRKVVEKGAKMENLDLAQQSKADLEKYAEDEVQ